MNRKAFIPITALLGALLLALVAAMTPFVAGPDRAHAQSHVSRTLRCMQMSLTEQGTDPTNGCQRSCRPLFPTERLTRVVIPHMPPPVRQMWL